MAKKEDGQERVHGGVPPRGGAAGGGESRSAERDRTGSGSESPIAPELAAAGEGQRGWVDHPTDARPLAGRRESAVAAGEWELVAPIAFRLQ